MKLAYECAVSKELHEVDFKMPLSWKGGYAHDAWFRGFVSRNPEISMKKPEGFSRARAIMTNENVLKS